MLKGQGRWPVLQNQAGQGVGGGMGARHGGQREQGTLPWRPPHPGGGLAVPGSAGPKRESSGSQIHPWLSPSRAVLTITTLLTVPRPPTPPKVLHFKYLYILPIVCLSIHLSVSPL